MQPTNIANPAYFHKVVDCQWACPAHTPVPEYIRLIAQGRYGDAYMVNWASNVFPGILGRTCDRPCEPACRRGRVEENNIGQPEPVAICRLKRVAADMKEDVRAAHAAAGAPQRQARRLRRRRSCLADRGARPGPAGLRSDGLRRRSAAGRLHVDPDPALPPARVRDRGGDRLRPRRWACSFAGGAADRLDAVRCWRRATTRSSWAAARRAGATSTCRAARRRRRSIHIGIDWLASVSFGHVSSIGRRVIVLGGGNTAMDCCRSARRLGGTDVKVIVRSGFDEMKASPWEKEDAMHEGIPIVNYHVPKAFVHEGGRLAGMRFEVVRAEYDGQGRRSLVPTGEPDAFFPCDEVLIAVGQENAFPWIERDCGIAFDRHGPAAAGPGDLPVHAAAASSSAATRPSARRTSSRRWRTGTRPPSRSTGSWPARIRACGPRRTSTSCRRRWASTSGATTTRRRSTRAFECRGRRRRRRSPASAWKWSSASMRPPPSARRSAASTATCRRSSTRAPASNATPASTSAPWTASPSPRTPTSRDLRQRLKAPALNLAQDLYVSGTLKTGRVMVKDEDVCLHCGLCAERCPTGAWDMQKFLFESAMAGARDRAAVRTEVHA